MQTMLECKLLDAVGALLQCLLLFSIESIYQSTTTL